MPQVRLVSSGSATGQVNVIRASATGQVGVIREGAGRCGHWHRYVPKEFIFPEVPYQNCPQDA